MKPLCFPRAVIFDWDNTLVDSWGSIGSALNRVRGHFGQDPWNTEEVRRNSTRSAREIFPDWYGDRCQEAMDLFRSYYREIHMQDLRPLDGAEDLLCWLQGKKIPMMVVSNKTNFSLSRESAALGWDPYFASLVGSNDAPRDKPARDPADHALWLAGLEADPSIWLVGDSETDIACARNATCTPVLIGTEEEAAKFGADLFASDCRVFLDLLKGYGIP